MALKESSFVGSRYFVIYCFPLRVALRISSRHGRERECGIACNDDTCKRIASPYQSTSEKKGVKKRDTCMCRRNRPPSFLTAILRIFFRANVRNMLMAILLISIYQIILRSISSNYSYFLRLDNKKSQIEMSFRHL